MDSKQGFGRKKKTNQTEDLLARFFSKRYYCEMLLDITTAPVRLLDGMVIYAKGKNPVRIDGQWYYPLARVATQELSWLYSSAVSYQNKDSLMVDLILYADLEEGKFYVVRGYDYEEDKKSRVLIPDKIEIFEARASGVLIKRLVRIEY